MPKISVIGTTLDGKYRIDRLVGAGAMGAVYEAEHTHTGRRVAIKVISSGEVGRDKKLVARFHREAKAAGAIDTQHITQVLDAGVDEGGSPYLVMELLQGEDLQSAIKRLGPLPPDLALRVVAQACLGLQKAHEAGVVHRDIKPANLFLARRDAGEIMVKLLDFGIAKVKMDHASDTENMALTKTGSMLGSPLYMSPEQAKGLKSIDHRADLWSLGVVLYQELTGKTPYDHCDALGGLIIAICHEDVTPVQELAPWVSPEVAAIVHRALQRDPAARFQSASEMFDAVKQLIPGGFNVNQEMLMPLSDTQKAAAVRRLSVPPGGPRSVPPPGPRSMPPGPRSAPPPAYGAAGVVASIPPPPALPGGLGGAMTTNASAAMAQSGSDTSPPTVRSAPPSRAPIVFAGVGVAALAAVGVWYSQTNMAPPAPATSAARAIVTATATVSASPPPSPVVSVSATATAEAPKLAPKRVKVVILPADASVEIAGAKAPVREGLLEITGLPGSVHAVRVWKGKSETTVDVTITDNGPSPTKIELGPKH